MAGDDAVGHGQDEGQQEGGGGRPHTQLGGVPASPAAVGGRSDVRCLVAAHRCGFQRGQCGPLVQCVAVTPFLEMPRGQTVILTCTV